MNDNNHDNERIKPNKDSFIDEEKKKKHLYNQIHQHTDYNNNNLK